MKKYILIIGLLAVSGIVFAQLQSSVIKNTAGTEVFSVNYGSGAATVVVAGVVSATGIANQGDVSVTSNLTVRGGTTLDNVVSTGTLAVAETALVSGNTTLN